MVAGGGAWGRAADAAQPALAHLVQQRRGAAQGADVLAQRRAAGRDLLRLCGSGGRG